MVILMEKHFYRDISLNGQTQCFGCKQKDIYNVNWSCFMFISKVDGHYYCEDCAKKLCLVYSKKN